ncbi:MAG: 6-phosphogluconolactonase [Pyrinomonadaceae bacterium]
MQINVFQTVEKLNEFAAEKFIEIGSDAIKKRKQFTVALAGGSTPKSLYQLLALENYRNKLDWSSVFFFFSDERNVPPDNVESNFRMADENLFQLLKIHEENIYRWHTDFGDEKAIAEDYETKIMDFFDLSENQFPNFDLILLGIGDDGHTASLFPDTKALKETEKIVVENYVEKLKTWRYTFSFPSINNAENIIFLVKGKGKSETLKQVLEGEFQPEKFPSQKVSPNNGKLFWLLESDAAGLLGKQIK